MRVVAAVSLVVSTLFLGGCVVVVDHDDHWDGYSNSHESPRIGVSLAGVAPATASQAGVDCARSCIITDVTQGSPAAAAGLQAFDVVTAIDGRDYATQSALREAIRGRNVGETITLTVVRGGKKQDLVVTVGEW